MACLSTSGRVACGSRRQQAHKLICRLFLNHSLHSRQSSQLVAGDTPGHARKYRATHNEQLARSFHGLSFGINQDYLSLLVSRKSGGNDINCNTQWFHTCQWPPTRLAGI